MECGAPLAPLEGWRLPRLREGASRLLDPKALGYTRRLLRPRAGRHGGARHRVVDLWPSAGALLAEELVDDRIDEDARDRRRCAHLLLEFERVACGDMSRTCPGHGPGRAPLPRSGRDAQRDGHADDDDGALGRVCDGRGDRAGGLEVAEEIRGDVGRCGGDVGRFRELERQRRLAKERMELGYLRLSLLRLTLSLTLTLSQILSLTLTLTLTPTRSAKSSAPSSAPSARAWSRAPRSPHISLYLSVSPYIPLYLPTSPYISAQAWSRAPRSPHISLYLSVSPYISLYLPTSPYISARAWSRARRSPPSPYRSPEPYP